MVDENGLPPVFSAWSRESFFAACKQMDDEQALWMKWSYSDSPYFEFGAVYFAEANGSGNRKGVLMILLLAIGLRSWRRG